MDNVDTIQRRLSYNRDELLYGISQNRDKCIHFASFNTDPSLLWFILKNDVNPDVEDTAGETPLMYASKYGILRNVQILLAYGADVTIKFSNSLRILCETKCNSANHKAMARLLLQHGADPLATDGVSRTPFMEACFFARIDAIEEMAKWLDQVESIDKTDIQEELQDRYNDVLHAVVKGQVARKILLGVC